MAVKYILGQHDINGVLHEVEISSTTYTGSSTEIDGNIIYGLNNLNDLKHPIRAKRLQLDLLAVEIDDYEDLLSSDEREWAVTYKQDGDVVFFGYITSENVIQTYAVKERYISFDVLDPLAFLQDLAYVDNSTGSSYTGSEQLIKIIANCLRRCLPDGSTYFRIVDFVPYDFRVISPISGTTTNYTDGRFLKETMIDQDQFIDDETGEISDCSTILFKILDSLQLCVTQLNGDTWILYHYLYDLSTIDSNYVNSYDSNGDFIPLADITPFSTEIIHSDNPDYVSGLLHCNQNQQYYVVRGVQKLAVDYEFIAKKQILENPDFSGGSSGGASMPGWFLYADYAESTALGYLKILKFDLSIPDFRAAESTTSVIVDVGNIITIKGRIQSTFDDALLLFNVRIDSPNVTNPYYLAYFGEPNPYWTNFSSGNSNSFIKCDSTGILDFDFELPKIPDFGELFIELYACRNVGTQDSADPSKFIKILSLDLQGSQLNKTGRRYNTTLTDKTVKSESASIFLDTDRFNINANQLMHTISLDPLNGVRDTYLNDTFFYSLGSVYSRNLIKSKKTRKIFTGDVFGFVDCHKYISIPDLSDNDFVIIEHLYDCGSNITTLKLEERTDDEVLYTQTVEDIYANEIKPTIKA